MREESAENRFAGYVRILDKVPNILARIRLTEDKCSLTDASRLYLYVFVPVLWGFTEWVLRSAAADGIEKLYFLSRDGWQMYLIAQKIVAERGGILHFPEVRYLNVSRYSMRIPGYHLDIDRAIESICVNGVDVTPERILKRAALTPVQVENVLANCSKAENKEAILNYRQIMELKDELKGSALLKAYIYDHSVAAYAPAAGYLKQEGLMDGRCAIADSGWIGTLQQSMEQLLESAGSRSPLTGYYFGMYETPPGSSRDRFKTYYFSARHGIERKVRFANSLFESIATAPEGMTVGYEEAGGSYRPVRSACERGAAEQKLQDNLAALQTFLKIPGVPDISEKGLLAVTWELLERFMSRPSSLEVACYGDNLFSDDVRDDRMQSVAAVLSEKEIKDQRFFSKLLIIMGLKKATIRESAWIEGSIVRSGRNIKASLRHARAYKRFVYTRKQAKRI